MDGINVTQNGNKSIDFTAGKPLKGRKFGCSKGKLDIINNTADFLRDAENNNITILPIKPV